jgi:hypothetical protein
MLEICNEVNETYKQQKKTDKQKEYMVSFDEVKSKVEKTIEDTKTNPTIENYQKCLAAAFSSGIFSPPRRSEFANVKINNYDREKDNYLLKNKIIFNNYKTSKKYGKQVYDINPNIMPILKKFLKINKT